MKMIEAKLLLTSSPFLKAAEDTPYIMRQVIYALLPAALAGIYYFGLSALLVILVSVGGAAATERFLSRRNTLHDGSAVLTGLLLAMVLPPGIPLWMALVGAVVAIAAGKLLFGGIGANPFNPALVGRAFLQAAFPVALTTWSPTYGITNFGKFMDGTLALPFAQPAVDAVATATPLARMKFEGQLTDLSALLLGNTAGSLGETCALLLLAGGLYLAVRNFLNWRIPLSIFATVLVLAALLHRVDPQKFAPPLFHLLSGGLVLGALFMATDPVTSPITQRGCWIFGIGIGVLVVIIRNFGGLPEGVMYAILLMNAATPLLNQGTHPRIYGEVKPPTQTGPDKK